MSGPGLGPLHILSLPVRVLRYPSRPWSSHSAFRSKTPRASKSWEALIVSVLWSGRKSLSRGPPTHFLLYCFGQNWVTCLDLDHLPWDQRTPTWNVKQNQILLAKENGKSLEEMVSVSHTPHTISLGLSMCVRLPRALTCFARGTPTRGPSPAFPKPQQRWVSSPRLAETLGHVIDYYVIDSSDPIRVAPPRQALFSLSFVSPGPSSVPST